MLDMVPFTSFRVTLPTIPAMFLSARTLRSL
jgi:hypothetical protein